MRRRIAGAAAIDTALEAGTPIARVLLLEASAAGGPSRAARAVAERASARGILVATESPREMQRMSEGAEREEILALAGPLPPPDLDSLMAAGGLVLLLSGVRYPANAGFVLRSAEVAGAAGVVLDTDWSASAREEASRVSIRADRFFSVLEASTEEAFEAARRTARRIVAVETVGGAEPWSVDLCGPIMLVLGSEAKGVPERFLEQADAVVRIPSRGFIPSYNVQAATGILLGEWLRQTITVGAVPLSRSTR